MPTIFSFVFESEVNNPSAHTIIKDKYTFNLSINDLKRMIFNSKDQQWKLAKSKLKWFVVISEGSPAPATPSITMS